MFLTLAEIKAYLGIPLVDTTYDDFLNLQGEVTTDAIEMYCQRKIMAANYVETFYAADYTPAQTLKTWEYPLNSISQIKIDGVITPIADIEGFRFGKSTGIITSPRGFFNCWKEELEITYNAGYVQLPSLLKYVYLNIIQTNYNKKKNGIDLSFGSDVQRVSIAGVMSLDFDYSLVSNEETTLMGSILGNYLNVVRQFRSERAVIGSGKVKYVT